MDRADRWGWWRHAVAGIVLATLAVSALALFGGQTSRILSTVGASVSSGGGSGSGQSGGGATGSDTDSPGQGSGSGGDDGSGPAPAMAGVVDLTRPELLIIKTGTLSLQVASIDRALAAATDRIEARGGYVSASEQLGSGDDAAASITFRIPVEAWTGAIEDLRELALDVLGEHTATEDVTGEVVDLRARIANLQVTEAALQAIMATATRIPDVLDVQDELTGVRGQIEAATGQLQRLEEQAAYSTLTVELSLEPAPAMVVSQERFDPQSEVDRAAARLVELVQALTTAGIWFAIVWVPVLLFLAISGGLVALVVALVRRRLARAEPVAT